MPTSSDSYVITAGRMGALRCQVRAGKLIASQSALPSPIENSLATTAPDQVYSQARIAQPMVRKGFLASPDSPQGVRGLDEYIAVSWQQALELIDQQHKRIRSQHGANAIFAGSYGWRSSASLHRAQHLLQRYMNLCGGYCGSIGDYSAEAVQVIMPYVTGEHEAYAPQTSYPVIVEHSEVVVLWGTNPLNTLKVAFNSASPESLELHQQLKAANKTLIAIDPMRSETIEFYGEKIHWIAPHPQTDVALMLGIAHHLAANDLHDTEFLATHCEGYDIFERYLLGVDDGEAKDIHWAAQICGVPATQIAQLAILFSQHRTMFLAGWAMQRQEFGEQRHWMLAVLSAMLGQIGTAGGGFTFAFRLSAGGKPFRLSGISAFIKQETAYRRDTSQDIPVARLVDALENPNQAYQYNGEWRSYPELKFIWWAGGANFTHHQDTHRLIQAWQKPACIVVSEIYWTAAAKHADIVLPITTSFERNDIIVCGEGDAQHLVPMKQVVAPINQARNDYDVFAKLSEMYKTGGRALFTENKTELEWIESFYQQSLIDNPAKKDKLPPFEAFWQNNEMIPLAGQSECDKPSRFIRHREFREDPIANPLNTPSGKIEIYSAQLAALELPDCPAHPKWIVPTYYRHNAANDELQLISPHSAYRLHSQFNYSHLRERYAIANREPITINTQDARNYGIKTGDTVRVYNEQGQVLTGAFVTDGIKQGTICIHQGAWLDLDKPQGMCKNGNVNVLTKDIPSSALANGCAANSVLVRIEKYQGELLELTAFSPPPIAHFEESVNE